MSRATIRNAVATYFAAPAVTGLNKVFTAHPKRIEASWYRYGQPAGTYSGGVAIVAILSETEERRGIGGATSGKKWVHYEVQLEVFMHSIQRHSETAMADFDTLMDNIKDKLRADRYLNAYPSVVFEAGEMYLDGVYGEPRVLQDGSTEIWGAIRFEVSEFINA
jgi:hypothetical protein